MRRGLSLLLVSVACVACASSSTTSKPSIPSAAASFVPPPSTVGSPSPDAGATFRTQLEAALKAFEPPWYLYCFSVDEDGNMPRILKGAASDELNAAIDDLRGLEPPKGWLAVANEADDLAALAEAVQLNAGVTYVTYQQGGSFEAANAVWQEKVIGPCNKSDAIIRTIREHADAIP